MTTVLEDIRTRINAINATITGVNARETFDTNMEQLAPVIVPLMGRMTRAVNVIGSEHAEEQRVYTLLLVLGSWNVGLPSVTVQKRADQLVPLIHAAYLSRPHLELSGSALNYVKSVKVSEDTGIISFNESAAVQIPLTITYTTSYTLNGG